MTSKYQDHHGGGLWAYEHDDPTGKPFLLKNLAGIEYSAQWCADPALVDELRQNAARFYAMFPKSAAALGLDELLATPITDAAGVGRWTDSLCNASIPLPAAAHTGLPPHGHGCHHFPAPIVDIDFFRRADFVLWNDAEQAAVLPVAPPGSGDGRVQLAYVAPGSPLHKKHGKALAAGKPVILSPRHRLAKAAFAKQGAH